MALTEKLQILITADGRAAQAEFNNLGRTAEKSIGKTDDRIKQLSGQMVSLGAATVAAGSVAAVGLYKLAAAAGDLQESQNKANVVLGKEGARSLERYADSAASAAGISKRAATDAASTFAVFGKSAGLQGQGLADFSVELTQLAGDLASFSNTTTDEAIVAIGAALRGESEPIRQYGVLLDDATLKSRALEMGIYDGVGALTQQQRVLAAQAEILRQTTDAQGDFGRTSDSLANQQRQLAAEFENTKASIGEALLPAFQSIVGGVSDAVGAFNDLSDGSKSAIGQIAGLATAATLGVGGLSLLVGAGLKVVDTFSDLGSRLRDADGNLTNVGRTAKGAAAVLGAAGLAFAVYQVAQAFNDATTDAVGFNTALDNLRSSRDVVDINRAIAEGAEATAGSLDKFADSTTFLSGLATDATVQLGDFAVQIDDLQRYLEKLYKEDPEQLSRVLDQLDTIETPDFFSPEDDQAFADLQDAAAGYRESLEASDRAAQGADRSLEQFRGGIDRYRQSADEAAGSTGDFATELETVNKLTKLSGDLFDLAADRASSFLGAIEDSSAIDDLLGSSLDLRDSAGALLDGIGALNGIDVEEVASGFGEISDEASEALRDVLAFGDNAQAAIAGALQFQGAEAARAKADQIRDGLVNMLEAAGLADDQIQYLLQSIGLTEGQVDIAINLSGTEEALAKLQLLRDFYTNADGTSGIPAEIQTQVSLAISEGRFIDAANLISLWVQDQQDGLITNPLLIQLGLADADAVAKQISDALDAPNVPREVQIQAGIAIDEGRLTDAQNLLNLWKQDIEDGTIDDPLLIAMGLGDTTPASEAVEGWKQGEEEKPPAEVPVDADTNPALEGVQAFRDYTASNPAEISVRVKWLADAFPIFGTQGAAPSTTSDPTDSWGDFKPPSAYKGGGVDPNAGGGIDGNIYTPFANGGRFTAGTMALVGEEGPELVQFGAPGMVIPAGPTAALMQPTAATENTSTTSLVVNQQITTGDPMVAASESARKMRDAQYLAGV